MTNTNKTINPHELEAARWEATDQSPEEAAEQEKWNAFAAQAEQDKPKGERDLSSVPAGGFAAHERKVLGQLAMGRQKLLPEHTKVVVLPPTPGDSLLNMLAESNQVAFKASKADRLDHAS